MRPERLALLGALCLPGFCALALGADPVRVRVGNHPGFGRLVFDFPGQVSYRLTRDGDRVSLRFDLGGPVGSPPGFPRNVQGFTGGDGEATIVVAHGARVQPIRVGNNIAIDVWDPALAVSDRPMPGWPRPAAHAAGVANQPKPQGAAPGSAEPLGKSLDKPAEPKSTPLADSLHPPAAPPPAAPTSPPTAAPPQPAGPAREAARTPVDVLPADPDRAAAALSPPAISGAPLALAAMAGPAGSVRLPFARDTGLAAFLRGATALLVFDERRPIDMSAMRDDPVFGSATVQLLPDATVVRLPLLQGAGLAFARSRDGWAVTVGPAAPPPHPIDATIADRGVTLGASAPGRVLNVADPDTGGMLLVATQREAGQAVLVARRASEFVLLPTWQGIAVEPLSDSVFLRGTPDGFVLGAEPAGLALSAPAADAAAYAAANALTRRYDFPPLPPAALLHRLQGEIDAVAAVAPLARARERRAAAATMVALGLGAEAQSMLRLAATEDAREVDDPDASGLAAIAALLAGRTGEADGLRDPRLDGSDEIALWRAVRQAMTTEGSAPAAQVFAATLPLLLAYPPPLRDRLLPLAAETLALNASPATGPLLARWPDEPRLKLARALWQQAIGDRDGALALLDGLAAGPDRLARLRGARRAVDLRLAAGLIDAHQAADQLGRQLYAWRGGRREIDLRLHLADLRARAGEWRPALALLRETETLGSQEDRPAIHARLAGTFAAMLGEHNIDGLAPLDLVAMLDENADLLPDGDAGTELAARLADRLMALDLPRRADAVLTKLVGATSGPVRARFGARLAGLRLREGDDAAALATLADTDADGLPLAVQQERALVRAGAMARRGDPAGAAGLLADIGTDQAAEMRAAILEQARQWPMAEQALADYVARTVPPDGALNDGQRRTVLRLAGATAQAGDAASLDALRQREGKRMVGGPLGDMFRLLTESPVRGGADLPRAEKEIALARSVPAGLKAMEPAGQIP